MSRVQLIGHYGSDKQIALAAWTSTSRELTPQKEERIPKLVEDLFTNRHMTCFERGILHFLVETDIASHIHLIKHRTIGTNGESARYKELKEDKMYFPPDWKEIKCSAEIEDNDGAVFTMNGQRWSDILHTYAQLGNDLYHQSLKDLTPILGRKRAKESARYFKTYNSVITTDVILNMSSFANFYKLRHNDKAQLEISEIAAEMMELAENIEGNPFETTLRMIKNQ